MPPPRRYPPPHEQLGELMVRARRRGLTFDEFWAQALRPGEAIVMVNTALPPPDCILWPTDRTDREAWRTAIMAAREGWRRAYERVPPTSAERALVQLRGVLAELDGRARADDGIEARAAVA